MKIGVISDTHGRLHPSVIPFFQDAGVEMILHAGDVGDMSILAELERLAPVTAVRGNVDTDGELGSLPEEVTVQVEDTTVYITHVGRRPEAWIKSLAYPRPAAVINGHSHIALMEDVGGVLFLNPGSAGTRPRFGGGLSAAILYITGTTAVAEIITLPPSGQQRGNT